MSRLPQLQRLVHPPLVRHDRIISPLPGLAAHLRSAVEAIEENPVAAPRSVAHRRHLAGLAHQDGIVTDPFRNAGPILLLAGRAGDQQAGRIEARNDESQEAWLELQQQRQRKQHSWDADQDRAGHEHGPRHQSEQPDQRRRQGKGADRNCRAAICSCPGRNPGPVNPCPPGGRSDRQHQPCGGGPEGQERPGQRIGGLNRRRLGQPDEPVRWIAGNAEQLRNRQNGCQKKWRYRLAPANPENRHYHRTDPEHRCKMGVKGKNGGGQDRDQVAHFARACPTDQKCRRQHD